MCCLIYETVLYAFEWLTITVVPNFVLGHHNDLSAISLDDGVFILKQS